MLAAFTLILIFASTTNITFVIDSKTTSACINNAKYEFKLIPDVNINPSTISGEQNKVTITLPNELSLGTDTLSCTARYTYNKSTVEEENPVVCNKIGNSIEILILKLIENGNDFYFTIYPIKNPPYAQEGTNFSASVLEFDSITNFTVYKSISYSPNDLISYSLTQSGFKISSYINITLDFKLTNPIPAGGFLALSFPIKLVSITTYLSIGSDALAQIIPSISGYDMNITTPAISAGLAESSSIRIVISNMLTPSSIITVSGFVIRTCDANYHFINQNLNSLSYCSSVPGDIIVSSISVADATINAVTSYEITFSMPYGIGGNSSGVPIGKVVVYLPTELSLSSTATCNPLSKWNEFAKICYQNSAATGEQRYMYTTGLSLYSLIDIKLVLIGVVNAESTTPSTTYLTIKSYDANNNLICQSVNSTIQIITAKPGLLTTTLERVDSSVVSDITKLKIVLTPADPYFRKSTLSFALDKNRLIYNPAKSSPINDSILCTYSSNDSHGIITCSNDLNWCSATRCTQPITLLFNNIQNPSYYYSGQDTSIAEVHTIDGLYLVDRQTPLTFMSVITPATITTVVVIRTASSIVGYATSYNISFTLVRTMKSSDLATVYFPSQFVYYSNYTEITTVSFTSLCPSDCPIGTSLIVTVDGYNPFNTYLPSPSNIQVVVSDQNKNPSQSGYNTLVTGFALVPCSFKSADVTIPSNLLAGQPFELKVSLTQMYNFSQYGIIETTLPPEMAITTKDGNAIGCSYQIDVDKMQNCTINQTSNQAIITVPRAILNGTVIVYSIYYAKAPTKSKASSPILIQTYIVSNSNKYYVSLSNSTTVNPYPNNFTYVKLTRTNSVINAAYYLLYNITLTNPLDSSCTIQTHLNNVEVQLSTDLSSITVEILNDTAYYKVDRVVTNTSDIMISFNPCYSNCPEKSTLIFRITGFKNPGYTKTQEKCIIKSFDGDGYSIDMYTDAVIDPFISAGPLTNMNLAKSNKYVGEPTTAQFSFTLSNPINSATINITINNPLLNVAPSCSSSTYTIGNSTANYSTTCIISSNAYLLYPNGSDFLRQVSSINCNLKCESFGKCANNEAYKLTVDSCLSNPLTNQTTSGSIILKSFDSAKNAQVDGGVIEMPYTLLPQLQYSIQSIALARNANTPSANVNVSVKFTNSIPILKGSIVRVILSNREFELPPKQVLLQNLTSWISVPFNCQQNNSMSLITFTEPFTSTNIDFFATSNQISLLLVNASNAHANYSKADPYVSIGVDSANGYGCMISVTTATTIDPPLLPLSSVEVKAALSDYHIGHDTILTLKITTPIALYTSDIFSIGFSDATFFNTNAMCSMYDPTTLSYAAISCTAKEAIAYMTQITFSPAGNIPIQTQFTIQISGISNSYHYLAQAGGNLVLSVSPILYMLPSDSLAFTYIYTGSYGSLSDPIAFITSTVQNFAIQRTVNTLNSETNLTIQFTLPTMVSSKCKVSIYLSKLTVVLPSFVYYTLPNILKNQMNVVTDSSQYILYFSAASTLCSSDYCDAGDYKLDVLSLINPNSSAIKGNILSKVYFNSISTNDLLYQSDESAIGNTLSIPSIPNLTYQKQGNTVNQNTTITITVVLPMKLNSTNDMLITMLKNDNLIYDNQTVLDINGSTINVSVDTVGNELQLLATNICSNIDCQTDSKLVMTLTGIYNPSYAKSLDNMELFIAQGDMTVLEAFLHNTIPLSEVSIVYDNITDALITRSSDVFGGASNYSISFTTKYGLYDHYSLQLKLDLKYLLNTGFTCVPSCTKAFTDNNSMLLITFDVLANIKASFCSSSSNINCANSTVSLSLLNAVNPYRNTLALPAITMSVYNGKGLVEKGQSYPTPPLSIHEIKSMDFTRSSNYTGAFCYLSLQFTTSMDLPYDSVIVINVTANLLKSASYAKCYTNFKSKVEVPCAYTYNGDYISAVAINYGTANAGDTVQIIISTINSYSTSANSGKIQISTMNDTHDFESGTFNVTLPELLPSSIKNITLGYTSCNNVTSSICNYSISFEPTNAILANSNVVRICFTDNIKVASCSASNQNAQLNCAADGTSTVWISPNITINGTIMVNFNQCTLPISVENNGLVEVSSGVLSNSNYQYYDIGFYSGTVVIVPGILLEASLKQSSLYPLNATNLIVNFTSPSSVPVSTAIEIGIPTDTFSLSSTIQCSKESVSYSCLLLNGSLILSNYCALTDCSSKTISFTISGLYNNLYSHIVKSPYALCTSLNQSKMNCIAGITPDTLSQAAFSSSSISLSNNNVGFNSSIIFNATFLRTSEPVGFNISFPNTYYQQILGNMTANIIYADMSFLNTSFNKYSNGEYVFINFPIYSTAVSTINHTTTTIEIGNFRLENIVGVFSLHQLSPFNTIISSNSVKLQGMVSGLFKSVAITCSSYYIKDKAAYTIKVTQDQIIIPGIQYVITLPATASITDLLNTFMINGSYYSTTAQLTNAYTISISPNITSLITSANSDIQFTINNVINPENKGTYSFRIMAYTSNQVYINYTTVSYDLVKKIVTNCTDNCSDCVNSTYCKACVNQLLNGKCYEACPYDYYPIAKVCTPCSEANITQVTTMQNVTVEFSSLVYGAPNNMTINFSLSSCTCENSLRIIIPDIIYQQSATIAFNSAPINYKRENSTAIYLSSAFTSTNCNSKNSLVISELYAPTQILTSQYLMNLHALTQTQIATQISAIDLLSAFSSLNAGYHSFVDIISTTYGTLSIANYFVICTTTQLITPNVYMVLQFPSAFSTSNSQCVTSVAGTCAVNGSKFIIQFANSTLPTTLSINISNIQNPSVTQNDDILFYSYIGNYVTYTNQYPVALSIQPISTECNSHCKECKNSTYCLICSDEYVQYNGTCLTACPSSYVAIINKCVQCAPYCSKCDSQLKCSRCLSPFYQIQGKCKYQCPSSNVVDFNRNCKTTNCSNNCVDCIGTTCSSCILGYLLVNKTKACEITCNSYSAINENICYECGVNYGILTFMNGTHCTEECPNDYYGDLKTLKCLPIEDSSIPSIIISSVAVSASIAAGVACIVLGGNFILATCSIATIADVLARMYLTVSCVRAKESAILFSAHFSSVVFNTFVFLIFMKTSLKNRLRSNAFMKMRRGLKNFLIACQAIFGMGFARIFYCRLGKKEIFSVYSVDDRSFNISLLMHNIYSSAVTVISMIACIYDVVTSSRQSILFTMGCVGICSGAVEIASQVYEVVTSVRNGRYSKLRAKI